MAHVVRMCLGCRKRAAKTELLLVAVKQGPQPGIAVATAVPDPRRRLAGRGAWIHPDPSCLALAEKRRALSRALKIGVPVDSVELAEYVGSLH